VSVARALPLFGAKVPGIEYHLRPGAYALVFDAQGRVALVNEDGDWYLPGGGLEGDETPEQALHREVREECSCGVEIEGAFDQALEFLETRAGRRLEVLAHFFRARFVGEPTARWLEPEEACELVRRRSDVWAIRAAAARAGGERLIDLSHAIHDGLITYPGLPGPKIGEHLTRATSRAHYAPGTEFSIGRIEMVSNTGTYIDSPFHRFEGGKDLAELELAGVADLDGLVVRAPRGVRSLGPELFRGRRLAGRAVLVDTGWSRHFATAQYGAGHPFLTRAAAEHLLAAGARLVGIDSLNIDDTADGARPVHTLLLGSEVAVVEHLVGLERLPEEGFRFFAVPVKVRGLGSFPVRAFALRD
jgi:kynurenine formamidase/8-oxo-dGTP pyrophosphatase MutT (NUDIX family)